MTLPLARWRRLRALSLRARLAAFVAVAVGVAVAVAAVAAWLTVGVQLRRSLDDSLLSRARAAVGSPLGDPSLLVRLPAAALGAADLRVALLRADGTAISAEGALSAPPLGPPELAVARGQASQSVRSAHLDGNPYRVVAVPAGLGAALVLARSTQETDRALAALGGVLLLTGALGIGGAATVGLLVARAALRPVDRLTAAAEHVSRTEDLRPIEVPGSDELGRMAASFNAMLAALARSRERQRQLVADAGHELRTPLTSLRTNLDLLAQSEAAGAQGLPGPERAQLVADLRAQVEEMSGLVVDLVELSREDRLAAGPEPVDLAAVVERALDRVRRRAPEVHVAAEVEPWLVVGDPGELERAVTNLLDNAAKWSPAGGTVRVTLQRGVLRVADAGPGIAEADLPHVFDRFYRAPAARALPGSGLGLAIVRQAAERHGGWVRAGRAPEGGAELLFAVPGRPAGSSQTPG